MRHIEWLLLAVALAALVLVMGGESGQEIEATSLERRMESVLSCVEGAGRVRVLVRSEEVAPAFAQSGASGGGVLVVAEGADDLRVRLALQQAVQALLGIDASQIEVLDMEQDP